MDRHPLPPDETILRRFLTGELSGPELDSVADYLDRHPDVASALSSLTVNDTLLSALKSADGAVDAPEVSALVAKMASLGTEEIPPTPQPSEAGLMTVSSPAGPVDSAFAATADPDLVREELAGMLSPAQRADELGRLGRYRVLQLLGRGGMGAVFAAEDERLKRRVALKVMLPSLAASTTARQRFVREAEAAAKVEHDNIVPIYDIGEDRGIPFLAMPLLVGGTLDAQLRSRGGPLAVADVLVVGRQIAEGLAAAHNAGLIHRDVKPSNVWLERTPAGAFRRARILDFGLARATRGSGEHLTHTGAIMGTPAYMAPEQARGAAVDHRADLFSLGCVLYQMATGRRPFGGDDAFAILTALAVDYPPAPAELNPHLPPALSALVVCLLAKNPDERWPAAAEEVADALAAVAADPNADPGSLTHIAARGPTPVVVAPPAPRPEDVWSEVAGSDTEAEGLAVVAPGAEPARRPKPRPRGRGLPWVAFGLFFVLFASAAYQYGGQVIRVITNEGELVVEVDDPNIEVTVRQNGVVIKDATGKREYVLKAGSGEVAFHDPQGGAEAVTKTFQIKRGEKVVLKASMADVVAARKKPDPPKPVTPARSAEPRLPAGDAAPDRDAFPGRLVFYDAFDDPKACTLPLADAGPVRCEVKDGRYSVSAAGAKADEFLYQSVGPGTAAGALAVRVRAQNGKGFVNFRSRGDQNRSRWIGVTLGPQGGWSVSEQGQNWVDGGWAYTPSRPLASGGGSGLFDLEKGVSVAVRWSETDYEVWLNGKRVAAANLGDGDLWPREWTFQAGSRVEKDGPARFEMDYAAAWDSSPAGGGDLFRAAKSDGWIAVSDDGKWLAVPVAGNEVLVFDTGTRLVRHRLAGHADRVMRCAFSPDGARVVTASLDGTARVWSLETGRTVLTLNHGETVLSAAFRPKGGQVATGGARTVCVWSADTGEKLHTLVDQRDVHGLAYHQAGDLIAAHSHGDRQQGPRVVLWNPATGEAKKLAVPASQKKTDGGGVAFSPDGTLVAAGDRSFLRVWSLPDYKEVLARDAVAAGWVAFGPDSKELWTGPWWSNPDAGTGRVRRWDAAGGKELAALDVPELHPAAYVSFALTKDGKTLYVADWREGVWACDPITGRPKSEPRSPAPEQRAALQWVLDNGGNAWIDHGAGAAYVGPQEKLPNRPFTLSDVGLIRNDLFAQPPVERLRQLPPVSGRLDVGGIKLADVGLGKLAELPPLNGIAGLRVAGTPITDAGLAHFKKFPRLAEIDASDTGVGDPGLEALAALPGLRALNLRRTRITDAGLGHLARMPDLTTLLLDENESLTAAGLKGLAACKKLTTLSVLGTKVTAAGAKELAAALPGCRVEYSGGSVGPLSGGRFGELVGKDLTGWQPDGRGTWTVAGGALVGSGGQGSVMSDGEYADFELTFEYRLAAGGDGDGGIFLRAIPGQNAIEVQLFDDARAKDRPFVDDNLNGALYGIAAPLAAPKAPAGEWNAVRVRFVGSRLTVEINGTGTVDADFRDAKYRDNPAVRDLYRASGRIGFQGGETKSEYRNVRVAPAAPVPVGEKPPPDDAFPGKVVLRDEFDGPGPSDVKKFDTKSHRAWFEKGVYSAEWQGYPERSGGTVYTLGVPAAEDVAFVARVRLPAGELIWEFAGRGSRAAPDDGETSVAFKVRPDGTWELYRQVRAKAGGGPKSARLAISTRGEPEFKDGKWFTLVVRSSGGRTEVWVDGRQLADVTEAAPPTDLPVAENGLRLTMRFPDKETACRFDIDHLTVWRLPPAKPAAAARKVAEWVTSAGGWVQIEGTLDVVTDPKKLPAGEFALVAVGLEDAKGIDDAALDRLGELKGFAGGIGLQNSAVTDDGLKKFAAFPGPAGLTGLYLDGTRVTADGIRYLAAFRELNRLGLPAAACTPAGLKAVRRLPARELFLSGPEVTDAGLKELAGAGLIGLSLRKCPKVTDAGLEHLRGMPLYSLDLEGTGVTDAGLEKITGFENLSSLDLDDTPVTDAGLAKLKALPGVGSLHLAGTKVTDDGIQVLAGWKALKYLDVKRTGVTRAGAAKLAEKLPACEITFAEGDDGRIVPKKK